ncbi:MAG: hypothetical protein H6R21_2044 [Proteobacteria bacterium]|nr:hypothetical protein [Pseudomonadota bacterium]
MLGRKHTGFSLVELIVGLAILGLLLALGVPQYATFIANSRLRATAEGVANGLNLARAEAVKRNARVELVLTNEEPIEALVNALPTDSAGYNWVVRQQVGVGNYSFIEGKVGAEGSGKTEGSSVVIASSSGGIVAFNGFGASASGAVSFQITSAAGLCAAAGGPLRCLNINVSPGGQIRVCDPNVTDAKDTRAC